MRALTKQLNRELGIRVGVYHTIRLECRHLPKVEVDFESHDVGFTQVTTLRQDGKVLAHYRPGTGHWDVALEVATKVCARAYAAHLHREGPLTHATFFAEVAHQVERLSGDYLAEGLPEADLDEA
jgi:hypothetical protein